jgi:hypothetical protein
MPDETPKSALELAMERLRKKDREEGVVDRPLTDGDKEAIGQVRRICEARLAEVEILHRSALAKAGDPEAAATLEEQYRRDRERILYDRDKKMAEIRERR